MNKTTKTYSFISLGLCILICIVLWLSSGSLVVSAMVSFVIFAIVFIWSIAEERLSHKRHYEIHKSEGFKHLYSLGFKLHKVNNYSGITGEYKGYIFDIYYDWETFVKPQLFRAVIFNIYFQSIDNKHKINQLNNKRKKSFWSSKKHPYLSIWTENFLIMRNGVSIKNPKASALTLWMDKAIETISTEKLKPITREELALKRKLKPNVCVPLIELYINKKDSI